MKRQCYYYIIEVKAIKSKTSYHFYKIGEADNTARPSSIVATYTKLSKKLSSTATKIDSGLLPDNDIKRINDKVLHKSFDTKILKHVNKDLIEGIFGETDGSDEFFELIDNTVDIKAYIKERLNYLQSIETSFRVTLKETPLDYKDRYHLVDNNLTEKIETTTELALTRQQNKRVLLVGQYMPDFVAPIAMNNDVIIWHDTKDQVHTYEYNKLNKKIKYINTLEELFNMKIDITDILMNPPYSGELHLEVLDQLHSVYPNANIINISPINQLKEHFTYGRQIKLANPEDFHIVDIISEELAQNSFKLINVGSDLGIWVFNNTDPQNTKMTTELFGSKYPLIQKMWNKVSQFDKLSNHTKNYINCSKDYTLKFTYGLALSNHGLKTPSSYNLVSLNLATAELGKDSTHTRYAEFDNKTTRDVAHKIYSSQIMRFFYKEVLIGRCDYTLIPWFEFGTLIDNSTDINNYLINFFGLTTDELNIINTTMKDFI